MTHGEETEKLREARENLEAAQAAVQKELKNELDSLRTQLIFKQHEIETSRRAAPRVTVPSQPAGSPKTQRSDTPKTPHKPRATIPQGLSQRPAAPPPRPSTKARPTLPGFVNAFVMPSQRKNKEKVHTSAIEETQGPREQDLVLSPLLPISGPVKTHTQAQPDEGMEVDGGDVGGQTDSIIYSEVDFHMDLADDVKTPQPIADVSRASKSFDWVNWVCLQLLYLTCLGFTVITDETIDTRSRNVAPCPKYNPISACSTTAWCRLHGHVPLGLHVPYKCGNRLG